MNQASTTVAPLEPWGKLLRGTPDPALAPRLTLVAHCIDVAAVVAALLDLPTWRARLNILACRSLTDQDLARLCALAFLHDIGKAGAGFYSKGTGPAVVQAWRQRHHIGGDQLGHVAVVGPVLDGDPGDPVLAGLRQALGVDEVLAWGDGQSGQAEVLAVWLAAVSHHGTPLTQSDLSRPGGHATWTEPIAGYQPLHGLARLGAAVRQILPDAFAPSGLPLRTTAGLVHAFAGLVSLADWIGSNTAPGYFPFDLGPQDELRWPIARQRAREVLVAMRIDLEASRRDLQRRGPSFHDIFGVQPRDMQVHAGRADLSHLVVIEAETGSGKTEAALWRFKTLFEAGEVDALCFLLPTRVSATAIAQRIQTFVERLFPDASLRPGAVLAVPGYLRANGHDGQKALAGFEVLWPDVDAQDRPLYWAAEHSKRYFAAGCATATIDQFLLSVLQSKHAHLRGTVLLRSLVVVDEVHASDTYMTALLQAALDRHVKAGGHGLLMSATLTGEARARLLLAGQPTAQALRRRAALAAADAPYPCVSDTRQQLSCTLAAPARRVKRSVLPLMRDPLAVAEIVATAVAAGARVLVLRNTVSQAVATQQAIEARLGLDHPALFRVGQTVVMHHGRYAFEDRRQLDQAVEAAFGKPAVASSVARVLVGTQTLEISLDCDADLMITDIVPIDVLLQRLGRLHRHRDRDTHRPAGYTEPHAVVLIPPTRDLSAFLARGSARGLGLGERSAYENLLAIEATLRALEDTVSYPTLVIPGHNRALVEAGADTARLVALADELGGDWPEFAIKLLGKRSAQAAQAWPVLVRWDRDWNDGQWSDLGDEVRTRLGLDGVDLDLLQPWTSPLGSVLHRLTVPRWILPTLTDLPVVEQQAGDAQALQLTVAGRRLHYDRLGLRAG